MDKWRGLSLLLTHLRLSRDQLMAVGDGGNDLGMVANAGGCWPPSVLHWCVLNLPTEGGCFLGA